MRTLGVMSIATLTAAVGSLALAVAPCRAGETTSLASPPQDSISVCQLYKRQDAVLGSILRVRGRLVEAHGYALTDSRCPTKILSLDSVEHGPDLSYCRPPYEFGCPAGGTYGPVVTVVGKIVRVAPNGAATIQVDELLDPRRVPE
jgi:hypothetical protein